MNQNVDLSLNVVAINRADLSMKQENATEKVDGARVLGAATKSDGINTYSFIVLLFAAVVLIICTLKFRSK